MLPGIVLSSGRMTQRKNAGRDEPHGSQGADPSKRNSICGPKNQERDEP